MKKILVSGIIALSVISATSAAEVPSTTKQSTDLLTIASAGAFSSESAGVQLLSDAEMQEVRGSGWFSKWFKNNKWCIGSLIICR